MTQIFLNAQKVDRELAKYNELRKQLFSALDKDEFEIVASLLDNGHKSINEDDLLGEKLSKGHSHVKNQNTSDALHWAAQHGQTKMTEFLLDRGGDVHSYDDTPLRLAAKDGHTSTVRLLLDRGANIHSQMDISLLWAFEGDHKDTIKLLLDRGANVSDASKTSWTPSHKAQQSMINSIEAIRREWSN